MPSSTHLPSNANQVVGITEIQLNEDRGPLEQLKSGKEKQKLISALDGDVIQTLVIDAWPQSPIPLPYKEEACPAGEDDGRIMPPNQRVIYVALLPNLTLMS